VLERVHKALQKDGRFSAWQVTEVRGRSHQRYAVFDDVEARRAVEKHVCRVDVHVAQDRGDADHDVIGESGFVVARADEDLTRALDGAFERAQLVRNRAWTLPGPADSGAADVAVTDARIVEAAGQVSEEVGAGIAQAAREHSAVELASSEVFCDYERVRLVNSLGVEREREETSIYTEYVLLARGGDEEVEVYRAPTARRLSELELDKEIAEDVQATVDGLKAELPQTGVVDVVIGGTGVEELFDAFLAHASGPAAFERWTRLQLEQPIIGDLEGEPLTLSSDATLAGGRGSYAFDPVGLPGRRVDLVSGGRFVRRCNDRRHACWLDEPATGVTGNLVVASGERSEEELLTPRDGRPLYWLKRFSQLSPHPYTGSFSGEVRHGYRVDADGGRVPVKGGSVSGVVFDAFKRAWFSKERGVFGRTHAPRAVRLDGVQVTGA
jgi:predicted Zn-dependent protease